MAGQNSDSSSSSEESLVSEMETSSDEESSLNESEQLAKPFALPFLKKANKIHQHQTLNKYLNNNYLKGKKTGELIDRTSQPVPADFSPWWESLNTVETSGQRQSSSSHSGEGMYESWFAKSNADETTDSWLCGPKTKTSSSDSLPQVQDIDVPSIYGNVSRPIGRRALKKERKLQREQTTGKKWFDMKLPDVDSKTKMDMDLIRMRRALDPKKFFKQNDRKGLPKYFQLGTVVDEGTDFYSSRLTKKQRKQTLVEELMADTKIRQYNKRKYEEVQQKQRSKKLLKKKKT